VTDVVTGGVATRQRRTGVRLYLVVEEALAHLVAAFE
jgi:hypothetical protein